MTTFTVSDTWASQGVVNGNVTFTSFPAGTGSPAAAQINNGVLSVSLPVGSVGGPQQYSAAFDSVTLNGFAASIDSISFTAPTTSTTISLLALAPALAANVTLPLLPPTQGTTVAQVNAAVANPASSLVPTVNATYNLGSGSAYWNNAYMLALTTYGISLIGTSFFAALVQNSAATAEQTLTFPAATTATLTGTVTAPGTSSSSGHPGEIATDGSYIYICTAVNTWKRAAISTF